MKKQNGMNKLAFNKAAVTELNDSLLQDVNGGTSPGVFIASIALSYKIMHDYLQEN